MWYLLPTQAIVSIRVGLWLLMFVPYLMALTSERGVQECTPSGLAVEGIR